MCMYTLVYTWCFSSLVSWPLTHSILAIRSCYSNHWSDCPHTSWTSWQLYTLVDTLHITSWSMVPWSSPLGITTIRSSYSKDSSDCSSWTTNQCLGILDPWCAHVAYNPLAIVLSRNISTHTPLASMLISGCSSHPCHVSCVAWVLVEHCTINNDTPYLGFHLVPLYHCHHSQAALLIQSQLHHHLFE